MVYQMAIKNRNSKNLRGAPWQWSQGLSLNHFGYISRVHLIRDKFNNLSKGVAFITFNEKKNAQRAIDCLNRFGYDNLILQVEWTHK